MKEMDEFQQFAEELEDEEFMDDLEEYDEDIEDEEDTELKISDLTEEELQALQLLQELASVSEKLWNAHIAKLLEYNKTHEVKMKEETVTIEDGETYIVYSAYLPDEKEEDGIWVPLGAIPVEAENVKSRRGPRSLAKPTFWKLNAFLNEKRKLKIDVEVNQDSAKKMSNKGYLFSAYGSKIKVVKSNHRYTGTKNKDGSRTGQDWYYEYKVAGQKHNKHVTMYRVMSDCFCENEFGSEDNEIHHIRKKNQYKPSEGKECNRAENLQLLPREIHKNLTYYASKPDAEHNKELEEKIKNADCPSFQFPQEQFQDLLMAALYDCNVSGGKAIMYTTTITDNVEDIEAEAHVLDVGKILKQNLEECE